MTPYVEDFDARAKTWDDDPAKVERAMRIAEAIAAEVPSLDRARVLEYGSGTGLLGFALESRAAHVTLADTSREMLAVAREKIRASRSTRLSAVQLDLTAGELPDGRFDLICTLMTLHHIPDVDAILGRFFALTSSGGTLCICDLDREDGSFHGPGFSGHQGFDRAELAAKISRVGFKAARFSTPYRIAKETPSGTQEFPLFLAVAQKG